MLKDLQDLGLSEKEARVYLAALKIGRATADQLAKQAKIVRPTAYVQLENLIRMGLMRTYDEGKKTYFAPESPESLRPLIDKQKGELQIKERALQKLLPDLLEQFKAADGHRSVDALQSELDNALNVMRKVVEGKQTVEEMKEWMSKFPSKGN